MQTERKVARIELADPEMRDLVLALRRAFIMAFKSFFQEYWGIKGGITPKDEGK